MMTVSSSCKTVTTDKHFGNQFFFFFGWKYLQPDNRKDRDIDIIQALEAMNVLWHGEMCLHCGTIKHLQRTSPKSIPSSYMDVYQDKPYTLKDYHCIYAGFFFVNLYCKSNIDLPLYDKQMLKSLWYCIYCSFISAISTCHGLWSAPRRFTKTDSLTKRDNSCNNLKTFCSQIPEWLIVCSN